MNQYETVDGKEDDHLSNNRWREVTTANKYEKHRPKFLKLLEDPEDRWYSKVGWTTTSANQIEPDSDEVRFLHNAVHRAERITRQFTADDIYWMLKEDIIELIITKEASQFVSAPKNYGSLQFCADYQYLFTVTVRGYYLLPLMHRCIQSLEEDRSFLAFDNKTGYGKVEIEKHGRQNNAFTSPHELRQFVRIPFRLKNAPVEVQKEMVVIMYTEK